MKMSDQVTEMMKYMGLKFIDDHGWKSGQYSLGMGSIDVSITETSPLTTQVTLRHYNESGKYTLLQWYNVRDHKEIVDYKEVYK